MKKLEGLYNAPLTNGKRGYIKIFHLNRNNYLVHVKDENGDILNVYTSQTAKQVECFLKAIEGGVKKCKASRGAK